MFLMYIAFDDSNESILQGQKGIYYDSPSMSIILIVAAIGMTVTSSTDAIDTWNCSVFS